MEEKKIKSITIADNEEYLRQTSIPVDIKNDKELEENIKVLENYCLENEVMAMAAVQLGIPKRLVYLKNTNLDIIGKIQTDSLTEEERKKWRQTHGYQVFHKTGEYGLLKNINTKKKVLKNKQNEKKRGKIR